MTLLISCFAAITVTILWYMNANARKMKIGTLCFMYWGAALMWLVDAVAAYLEASADLFCPSAEDMLHDSFLGFSAIALGLAIWLAIVLVKDPMGTIRSALMKKHNG